MAAKTTKELILRELMKLYRAKRLSARKVVEVAKDPSSPLHHEIWGESDTEAAYKYRMQKARTLITWFEVTYMVHETPIKVNEFVHDPYIPRNVQGYVRSIDIKDDAQAALEFLRTELSMSKAYLERCLAFTAILRLDSEINKILAMVNTLIARVTPRSDSIPENKAPKKRARQKRRELVKV